jgi:hypothetical protein
MKKTYKTLSLFFLLFVILIVFNIKSVEAEKAINISATQLLMSQQLPLIDIKVNPKGLAVPNTFLGLHLNRWKSANAKTFSAENDYYQVKNVLVDNVNRVATVTTPTGHGFYNYRKGVALNLLRAGVNGADFTSKVTGGTLGTNVTPGAATLADMPSKLGVFTMQYKPYVPTFGYGAIRSHGSNIDWKGLHKGPNLYNADLMRDWVNRHVGKKLMFTMTGTPEWLASSNVTVLSSAVLNGVATIAHQPAPIGLIPVGSGIKVRQSNVTALNGEYVVTASTATSISFATKLANMPATADINAEVLIWGNGGGFGYNNPPKDMQELSKFTTWLMTNFGENITWIEGQNEANSSYLWDGTLKQNQGGGSWWMGSLAQLGEMQKIIYQAAKAVKPTVLIGSPALTGLTPDQPINKNSSNRSSAYQLLTASDGAGGKLVDWVDFVPFHVYDLGASGKLEPKHHWTTHVIVDYVHAVLNEPAINKPNLPIYMNEGGFEQYNAAYNPALQYFNSLTLKQQQDEIFKQAAIYAGYGVKGFYPWTSGFMGDYETTPEIAAAFDKVNKRIAGKTISPDAWFSKETGGMYFKTTDGYEELIP